MTSGVTWEGEDAGRREGEAPRRTARSVGEWLDSLMSERSRNEPHEAAPPARKGADLTEVEGRLDQVGRELDQLSRLNSTQTVLRPGLRDEEPSRDLDDAISRLDRRLDHLIISGRSASQEIDRRVGEGSQGAGTPETTPISPPLAPDGTSPLERALMEIAERQHALDVGGGPEPARSTRPDVLPRASTQGLSRLEDQLREISSRFEGMRPCGLDGAVETLRNDLAEIGLMLKEAMPRHTIEALEGEVRALSQRLECVYQASQTPTTDAAIAGVERGITEIRDALRALTPAENLVGVDEAVQALSHKIDLIATDTQDAGTLDQIENAIAALRGIATHAASDGALTRLSHEVRDLAVKVDQITSSADSGAELLSTLEHRIASIADALEARGVGGGAASLDLDSVVQGLADKLERGGFARSDQAALGQLEDRIARLIDKVDASNTRLNSLESIERGLTDLLAGLDHRGTPLDRPDNVPEVNDLRRDMQQTQSSLQSVQGALTQLVDRLAMIEADLRSGSGPAALASPGLDLSVPSRPTPTVHDRPSPQSSVSPATARSASVNEAQKPQPPAVQERRPIDPNLPPDHPLEPGDARARGGNSPVERIAASEAALGPVKPAIAPEPDSKSSFIAAARRAARAASSEAAARDDKRVKPAAAAATGPKSAGKLGERVKKVLIAASVVAILLSSLHLAMNLFGASEQSGDTPQSPTQQQGDNRSDGSDLPPANGTSNEASSAGQDATPGRQSLHIPMGDGTSIAFSAGTAPVQMVQPMSPTLPIVSAPSQVVSVPSMPVTTPDKDVTGSVTQPQRASPVEAQPQLASVQPARTGHPAATDKIPASIGGSLRAAAAKGDATAQYEIGQRYAEGRGVPQSLSDAAEWFDRAAKQGLAPAQFRLGGFYEKGFGVKKDLDMARKLYTSAADAGNAKAMHNLAVLYAEGIDGKPDYPTAAKWFRKAADYGLSDSQYNLGILFARGIGIDVNLPEAYKWFALAARDGDRESSSKRDDVGGRLDPASLAAAKLAVQKFVPQQQPDSATQAAVPPGGWDAVATTAPSSPKPRSPAPKLDLSTPPAH